MDLAAHHGGAQRGGNPIVYWLVRAVLQPFFHLCFLRARLSRVAREHVPAEGPQWEWLGGPPLRRVHRPKAWADTVNAPSRHRRDAQAA